MCSSPRLNSTGTEGGVACRDHQTGNQRHLQSRIALAVSTRRFARQVETRKTCADLRPQVARRHERCLMKKKEKQEKHPHRHFHPVYAPGKAVRRTRQRRRSLRTDVKNEGGSTGKSSQSNHRSMTRELFMYTSQSSPKTGSTTKSVRGFTVSLRG